MNYDIRTTRQCNNRVGRKRYSKHERYVQISRIMSFFSKRNMFTVTNVAFYVGMTPSTHLRSILNEMVEYGFLDKRDYPYRKNVVGRYYKITERGRMLTECNSLDWRER